MRNHSFLRPCHIAVVSVLLLGGVGCATKSDLEQLSQGMYQRLEASTSAAQTEDANLRQEVRSEAAEIREKLTAYEEKIDQALARIEALNKELTAQLQSVNDALRPIADFPAHISSITRKLRAIGQALAGNYEVEETVLRERLRGLAQARRDLDPLVGEQDIEARSTAVSQ